MMSLRPDSNVIHNNRARGWAKAGLALLLWSASIAHGRAQELGPPGFGDAADSSPAPGRDEVAQTQNAGLSPRWFEQLQSSGDFRYEASPDQDHAIPSPLAMRWVGYPAAAQAAQAPGGGEKGPSTYDRIWRFAEWYENDSNPVVQRVLFSGRFQHEFAAIDSDEGDMDEWNVRRMRLGPRVTLFRTFTLHGEVELNPQEADPFYMRFTDLYLQWNKSSQFALTVGKQGVPFTMDGATSSKELLAIDRSNLTNNIWFPQEYIPGVSVSGRLAPWIYRAGVYSAGRANRELGDFSGGLFTLGVVGYDFAETLGVKEALLASNYVYQNPDSDNTFTRQLEHILSINFKFEADRWGARTDVSAASGYLSQSDLWAFTAMPFFNITDKLQFVGRYTFVESADPNGVLLGTYENRVVRGRGDQYNELYLGANYFFYGHKLKLQSGVQFADMKDHVNDGGAYSGVSWTTGLRVGW
jgi:phosphate-selective porin OprO/OprP